MICQPARAAVQRLGLPNRRLKECLVAEDLNLITEDAAHTTQQSRLARHIPEERQKAHQKGCAANRIVVRSRTLAVGDRIAFAANQHSGGGIVGIGE